MNTLYILVIMLCSDGSCERVEVDTLTTLQECTQAASEHRITPQMDSIICERKR